MRSQIIAALFISSSDTGVFTAYGKVHGADGHAVMQISDVMGRILFKSG